MKKSGLLVLPFALAGLLLSACTTITTSRDNTYAMSEDEARQLILNTIEANWPDQPAEPLGGGRIGYSFPYVYEGENGSISIDAQRASDGMYRFVVLNHGKADSIGNPKRHMVLSLLDARASGLTQ